jgi:hypothetical protein
MVCSSCLFSWLLLCVVILQVSFEACVFNCNLRSSISA